MNYPAPFKKPPIGVVLAYAGGLTQTVTAVTGMRVLSTDNAGLEGAHVGLFVADNPKVPRQIDDRVLAAFWPLKPAGKATVPIALGRERWEAQRQVVGTEKVTVPAGTYLTYVVEGVQRPKFVANPKSTSLVTTWWYAPSIGAVVRFAATAKGGSAGAGVVRPFELVTVRALHTPATR